MIQMGDHGENSSMPGNSMETGHMYSPPHMPPMPNGQVNQPPQPPPQPQPQYRQSHSWAGNDANTLLVVATLITTLTYQLGSSIPGGYWQETVRSPDGTVLYLAGDPIMRDLHRPRYWVFTAANWVGFAGSMLMTLSLLVRMPVESRHVRWSFAAAYSSLVLTFIVSQPRTHLSLDILLWVVVVAVLWLVTSVRSDRRAGIIHVLCCGDSN